MVLVVMVLLEMVVRCLCLLGSVCRFVLNVKGVVVMLVCMILCVVVLVWFVLIRVVWLVLVMLMVVLVMLNV